MRLEELRNLKGTPDMPPLFGKGILKQHGLEEQDIIYIESPDQIQAGDFILDMGHWAGMPSYKFQVRAIVLKDERGVVVEAKVANIAHIGDRCVDRGEVVTLLITPKDMEESFGYFKINL
jgi:hypothetical protein